MYEYDVASMTHKSSKIDEAKAAANLLDQYASQGWEFFHSVITSQDIEFFYFRRFIREIPSSSRVYSIYTSIPEMANN